MYARFSFILFYDYLMNLIIGFLQLFRNIQLHKSLLLTKITCLFCRMQKTEWERNTLRSRPHRIAYFEGLRIRARVAFNYSKLTIKRLLPRLFVSKLTSLIVIYYYDNKQIPEDKSNYNKSSLMSNNFCKLPQGNCCLRKK